MNENATVYIVDDDEAARQSISMLIDSLGLNVKSFESAEDFLDQYTDNCPGCLVTDVRMNGISGLELQKRLLERNATLPVIVVTGFAETPLAVRAMKNGAIEFLEKPCRDQDLLAAVTEALKADEENRDSLLRTNDILIRIDTLSEGEKSVLNLMLDGKPNKIIAKKLDVSMRTVESRRHNIFEKMSVDSVAKLAQHVFEARKPK